MVPIPVDVLDDDPPPPPDDEQSLGVWEVDAATLLGWAEREPPRGEITLVVAGAPVTPAERPADEKLRAAVAEREAEGTPRREAIVSVAREYGLPRREVYNLVVSG